MSERHGRNPPNVTGVCHRRAFEPGKRRRCATAHQVSTEALCAGRRTYGGDGLDETHGEGSWSRFRQPPAQVLLFWLPPLRKADRVRLELETSSHRLGAHPRIARSHNMYRKSEPVQELRSQLSFFGVHRAEEHETTGVAVRHTLSLHPVDSTHSNVEKDVDQVVGQQVDLVHVKHSPVRPSK